jgi:RNA polymerase sigma factor (sigma-70 family)
MSGVAISTESSVDLVEAYMSGDDPEAADRLYHRHRDATLKLAENGMSHRLKVRVDPEDVYQSVSLILFRGLTQGQFHLTRPGDLRALLAQLTHRRIQKKVEQNAAEKRSLVRETPLTSGDTRCATLPIQRDTLEELEEIDATLSRLRNPQHQRILRMALDGTPVKEIAAICKCSEARVRQILRAITEQMMGLSHDD